MLLRKPGDMDYLVISCHFGCCVLLDYVSIVYLPFSCRSHSLISAFRVVRIPCHDRQGVIPAYNHPGAIVVGQMLVLWIVISGTE